MRTRTRGELTSSQILVTGAKVRQVYKTGTWPNYTYLTRDVNKSPYLNLTIDTRESIQDELGRGRFNVCNHTRPILYKLGLSLLDSNKTWNPNQMYYQVWQDYGQNMGQLSGDFSFQGARSPSAGSLSAAGLPEADWSELVYQVGQQLDGHMTTSQNLLVSVAQMSQTIGMFANPGNLVKMQKMARRSQLTLRELIKQPANAWLEYQFGWKNLYRDVIALYNVWAEVRKHQAFLQQSVDKYTSIAQAKNVYQDNPSIGLSSLSVGGCWNGYVTIVPKISRIRSTDRFTLDVLRDRAMASWSTMDQVLARLGARDVAEALWDLVPYSFVVDWFTHINQVIRRRVLPWNSFCLRYVGYSRKIEWLGRVSATCYFSTPFGTASGTFSGGDQVVQKAYQRFPGFPPATATVGLFGSLNSTQLSELAALIVQRI